MYKTQSDHYNDTSEKANCSYLVDNYERPKNWFGAVMEAWRISPKKPYI